MKIHKPRWQVYMRIVKKTNFNPMKTFGFLYLFVHSATDRTVLAIARRRVDLVLLLILQDTELGRNYFPNHGILFVGLYFFFGLLDR